MFRRQLQLAISYLKNLKMAEPMSGLKRPLDSGVEGAGDAKIQKTDQTKEAQVEKKPFYKKKKCAMMLIYSGKGYLGMQRNPGFKTIEDELLKAFVKAGIVTEDHATQPSGKMQFQRAARTDKGVSAAGQVVSLKMYIDVENAVEKINENLPGQIRVIGFKQATKGFNSKNNCDSRTYTYVIPTYAFTPIEEFVQEDFRVTPETLSKVRDILKLYKGTHNFHNFTSGKKPNDPSANRYIIDFQCGEPFVRDGIEFVAMQVKGQSFMIHHIRKMVGLMVAIIRGLTGVEAITRAWGPAKVDVPKAPGLGLLLEQLHYDAYNKKFASDGSHEAIEWSAYKDVVEKFKDEYIYETIVTTEKFERSMIKWLSTLPLHHFEERIDVTKHPLSEHGIGLAKLGVDRLRKEEAKKAETSEQENVQSTDATTENKEAEGSCDMKGKEAEAQSSQTATVTDIQSTNDDANTKPIEQTVSQKVS